MALKLYNDTDIQNIANAIRSKNESSDTYLVSEMAQAISQIPKGELKYDVLFTNENPTQDFAGLTLNIPNINKYDFITVITKDNTTASATQSVSCKKSDTFDVCCMRGFVSSVAYTRACTLSWNNNQIQFENTSRRIGNTGTSTLGVIPLYVYGYYYE